jgi:hypothetical protein
VLRYPNFYFPFFRVLLLPVWGLATGWKGRLRHGERFSFLLGDQLAGEEFNEGRSDIL